MLDPHLLKKESQEIKKKTRFHLNIIYVNIEVAGILKMLGL
jgi:hypothetical protein